MNPLNRPLLFAMSAFCVSASLVLGSLPARAEEDTWELESDPIAFALSGYSLHAIRSMSATRVDLGVFGIAPPKAVHGNEGFSQYAQGFGVKLDYFGARKSGWFAGMEANVIHASYTHDGAGAKALRNQLSIGPRLGYRFGNDGFYVTPWIGLGYAMRGEGVTLAGEKFEESPWIVFPTIHVGYSF